MIATLTAEYRRIRNNGEHFAPLGALSIFANERVRVWVSCALFGICILAAGTYVFAVNTILLHGEAMKQNQQELQALERRFASLEESSVARQSPAWLEDQSQKSGMVSVGYIRHISETSVVAFSGTNPAGTQSNNQSLR